MMQLLTYLSRLSVGSRSQKQVQRAPVVQSAAHKTGSCPLVVFKPRQVDSLPGMRILKDGKNYFFNFIIKVVLIQ